MIKLHNLTPEIYYSQSRDFQFIGRLYDIALNAVKTNVDAINNIPDGNNMDESLLNLLAMTLGFKSQHKYNIVQLAAICSVFPTILRQKGSLRAIVTAVNALLYAEGIKESFSYSIEAKTKLTLYLPEQLSDLTLLKDLMTYILPAGLSCKMIKELVATTSIQTELAFFDSATVTLLDNSIPTTLDALNETPVGILRVKDPTEATKILSSEVSTNSAAIANSTVAQFQLPD